MVALQLVPQLVANVPTASADCGPSGGAAVVRFVSNGNDLPTAADVRAYIRTPSGDPDFGPTNIRQISTAVFRGWGVTLSIESPGFFDLAWDRLRNPRNVATWAIWYGVVRNTPHYASRSGFAGSHSIVVADADDDSALVADSLADGRAGVPNGPQRWSRDLLRRATGAVRVGGGLLGPGFVIGGWAQAKVLPQPSQGEPMLDLVPMTLRRRVPVPAGTVLYKTPDGPKYSTVTTAVSLGLIGAPNAEWYVVASGDRGVYVKRSAVGKPVVATVSVGR